MLYLNVKLIMDHLVIVSCSLISTLLCMPFAYNILGGRKYILKITNIIYKKNFCEYNNII